MNFLKKAFESLTETASQAASTVANAAGKIADAAVDAKDDVKEALPTADQVRHVIGDALVLGGKALIDPRAAAGEAAVKVGEIIKPNKGQE